MKERILASVSLANLVFLRSWAELLRLHGGGEASAPAARTLLWVTILSVALLAAVLLAGHWLASRSGWLTAARCAALFLLITPIDFLDGQVRPMLPGWISPHAFVVVWTILLLVPVLAAVRLGVYGKSGWYRSLRTLLVVLSPLAAILSLNLLWKSYGPATVLAAPALAGPVNGTSAGRVIWIVFDELDSRLAFDARPSGIEMPELDRLRKEGLFAAKAKPPAWDTPESMTTYILGQRVAKFGAQPFVASLESGGSADMRKAATIFSEARRSGANTYLTGWYLPYCQMLAPVLTDCVQPTPASIRPSSFAESFAAQWKAQLSEHWLAIRFDPQAQKRVPWFGWGERIEQNLAYKQMMDATATMVGGAGGRLVLVHLPIPHPLGIYDRRKNELSLDTRNNSLDNLELVDQTVGAIRRVLETNGLWDQTNFIVTSDHPMRPDVWSQNEVWSEEERAATLNRRHPWIPLLVKTAGVGAPVELASEVDSSRLTALALALLRGEVTSAEQAAHALTEAR